MLTLYYFFSSCFYFLSFILFLLYFGSQFRFIHHLYLSSSGSSVFQDGGRFLQREQNSYFHHFHNTANILIFNIQISSVLSILFAFLFITFSSRTMIKILIYTEFALCRRKRELRNFCNNVPRYISSEKPFTKSDSAHARREKKIEKNK
jgi:hypothetical protein